MKQKTQAPIPSREKKVFAICGKGGVGKTAFSAMFIRVLIENGNAGKLLVIDADPALGLANAINVHVGKTIGQIREAVITTAKARKETEVTEAVAMLDYMVMEALVETEALALVAMGRSETLGCFCSVNDLLRDALTYLSQNFDTTVIDCEAGLEQINRQVMDNLDALIILSDATSRGIQTVRTIQSMVEKEKVVRCRKMGLVFNKVRGNEEILKQYADEMGIEVLGYIPEDENIVAYDLVGRSLLDLPHDSPAQRSVRVVVNNLMATRQG
ncbi:MAG: ATP-binding protein [Syntrophorhabdaceae bacterium]